MKKLVKRTMAFMLVVCMLLSVVPPSVIAVDNAPGDGPQSYELTYNFVSGDGKSYCSKEGSANLLLPGAAFDNGSWNFLAYQDGPNGVTVGTAYTHGNMKSDPTTGYRFIAVKLNNIPVAGTAEMTLTVHNGGTSVAEAYILPGDTDMSAVTVATLTDILGEKAGDIAAGNDSTTSAFTAGIKETDLVNNSVVLVFKSAGIGTNLRLQKLEMTVVAVDPADKAAADAVVELIDAIGTEITEDSEDAIIAARAAYDALTDTQKTLVGNYAALESAENTFKNLGRMINVVYDFDLWGKTVGNSEEAVKQNSIVGWKDDLDAAYADETLTWNWTYAGMTAYHDSDPNGTATFRNTGYLRVYSSAGEWIAFQIKAPGEGEFNVSMRMPTRSNNAASKVGVYFLPAGDYAAYTDITAAEYLDAVTAAVGGADTSGTATALGEINFEPHTDSASEAIGKMTFEEGKEYLVVFKVETDDESSSEYMFLDELVMTGLIPDVDYDFTNNGVADPTVNPADSEVTAPLAGKNWTIYKTDAYQAYTYATSFQANALDATEGGRFVIELDNKRAGVYNLTFTALGNPTGGAANIYLTTTAPEGGWNDANIKALDLTTAKHLGLLDSCTANSTDNLTLTAEGVEMPEGKVYLVFQGSIEGANAAAGDFGIVNMTASYINRIIPADEAAAIAVDKLIKEIGTVTLEDEAAIQAARAAYDALTEEQKAYVKKYDELEAAEEALLALKFDPADREAAAKVDNLIILIGTVTLNSETDIQIARAEYDALTDTQKGLVTQLAVLEAAEQRLYELQNPADTKEYKYALSGESGEYASFGTTYGDFVYFAGSGTSVKAFDAYLQAQNSFVNGKWYGLRFVVEKAGDYDVALNLHKVGTNDVTLDVYFVRAENLVQGKGNTNNQAFVDSLVSSTDVKTYQVSLADETTWNLSGVQLDKDSYVVIFKNTAGLIPEGSEDAVNTRFNFLGLTINRTGDYTGPEKVVEPPQEVPDTDKLVYDFYLEGAADGTNVFDPSITDLTNSQFDLNKMYWTPVAQKLNTIFNAGYKTTFLDGTGTYKWKGMQTFSGVGEWVALKIKAPGTGTYDLTVEHGVNVNGTTNCKFYLIPMSELKNTAVSTIDTLISDNTYSLTGTASFKSGTGTTELGQAEFVKGQDYLLVMKATSNKHGTQKTELVDADTGKKSLYQAYIFINKLTATTYVPPEALNQKEVIYDLVRPDMSEGGKVFSEGNLGTLSTEYSKGESYWKPYATNIGTAVEGYGNVNYRKGTGSSYKFEAIHALSYPGEWLAFQIRSPGTGLYNLTLTYIQNVNNTTACEVHIIPLSKLTGDPVAAVDAAIASGTYKLQSTVSLKVGTGKYLSIRVGQTNFVAGEEYVVVFKATTNKHGSTSLIQSSGTPYQAFMPLNQFKLTYTEKVENFENEKLEDVTPEEPDLSVQADPEAAAVVINLIKAIGSEITLESSSAIKAARTAYELLTDNQKALVTNYQTLVDAEAKLAELVSADDKQKADAVIAKIDAIGEVTLESESAIVAARIAYTLLTNEQRALVTNYSVLLAAEAKLAELKGETNVSAMDQASADAVEALIDKIGTVTMESEVYISAARNAYNALTDTQKLLVENYADLVAAERAYAELKAEQDAAKAEEEAAKRKAQQITIMIVAAVVAVAAAGVVTVFAVPSIRTKVLAMFSKNKNKV